MKKEFKTKEKYGSLWDKGEFQFLIKRKAVNCKHCNLPILPNQIVYSETIWNNQRETSYYHLDCIFKANSKPVILKYYPKLTDIKIITPQKPLCINLSPYQEKALKELEEKNYRAILAFKAGLGKTFTSLALVKKIKAQKIMILCPKTKIPEWEADIQKMFPNAPVHVGSGGLLTFGLNGFYISTYQSVNRWSGLEVDYVILDESTIIKEPDTQTFKYVLAFIQEAKPKAVVCLTGTPALNHPYELFGQIRVLEYDNHNFMSWEEFKQRYCKGFFDTRYYQFRITGIKDPEGLKQFVSKYIITVDNETIKQELNLPPLKIKKIEIDNWIPNLTPEEIGKTKIEETLKIVKRVLEKNPKEQIVLFTWHRSVGEELKRSLPNSDFLHGQINLQQREKMLNDFKEGKLQFLIVNLKAAGMGINLQNAHIGILVELIWTPKLVEQAIKRLHRRGQTKPVYIAMLVLRNSLDEKILKNWKRKLRNINSILPT